MDGNEYALKRKRWLAPVIISVCMHLLFLLLFLRWQGIFLFPSGIESKAEDLTLEFVENQSRPNQLVETNNESATPPERADFLSDRHSVAQNPDITERNQNDMPFNQGDVAMGSILPLPQQAPALSKTYQQPDNASRETPVLKDGIRVQKQNRPAQHQFTRDQLLGIRNPESDRIPEPSYREMQSSVERAGGVSFNTYAWEWAPYMFKLKERLQKNMFPPASFTRLGFGGEHLIRFTISRDGSLIGPVILGYKGDKVLTETSSRAITLSAPFPPLPDDFPESHLEVTVHFQYFGKESFSTNQ